LSCISTSNCKNLRNCCTGNGIRCAYPPSLHKHGLVTIRELDIDRLCPDRRDGVGDIIDHLDEHGMLITDEVGLEPGSHVFDHLIVVVEDVRHNGIVRRSGNHELKKGVAGVDDIFRLDESPLGELVRYADVLAVPAVKTMDAFKWLIFGWQPRNGNLIGGSNGLLMEKIETLIKLVLQNGAKLGVRAGSDRLINEGDTWHRTTVKLG